ncbi:hypothetical protein BH11PLA2_BH11PLA2_37080 [soil metagenome]
MTLATTTATARTRQILEDLEAVRENLLALSDDIWHSINHNDPEALESGVEFKRAYNAKAAAFDLVASELSALVQQYTSVRLEEAEKTGGSDHAENDRIVTELNHEVPHHLGEDFTYKRPHGFILEGQGTTGITTWQRLYELVMQRLYDNDPHRFRGLSDDPDYTTNRGNPTFTTDPARLRKALEVRDGLFVESNLSANSIRDMLRRVLNSFAIPTEELLIFLRQDRDAGRAADAA